MLVCGQTCGSTAVHGSSSHAAAEQNSRKKRGSRLPSSGAKLSDRASVKWVRQEGCPESPMGRGQTTGGFRWLLSTWQPGKPVGKVLNPGRDHPQHRDVSFTSNFNYSCGTRDQLFSGKEFHFLFIANPSTCFKKFQSSALPRPRTPQACKRASRHRAPVFLLKEEPSSP